MYHPAAGNEFIELYNSGVNSEKLDGFTLFDPDSVQPYFTFLANTSLAPGAFLSVTPTAQLPDTKATVQLRNAAGAVLLEIKYSSDSPWPKAADGAGHSLVLVRPSLGENNPDAWAASERIGGSPGVAETNEVSALRAVKINEFLAIGSGPDWIELFNACNIAVDISGCYLSCASNSLMTFTIPGGTTLAPRGFVSFDENQMGFSLRASGEQIYFTDPQAIRILDAVHFDAQTSDVTTGRSPDGSRWTSIRSTSSG